MKSKMITILIVGNNIADNERIAGSIIGGTELSTCVICTHSASEARKVIDCRQHKIDLFIISIRMKEQSGFRLAEKIRKLPEYRDCPILFVTNSSYSLSGFSQLTTHQSYKKFNYISLPITRIDVQGKLGLYLEDILQSQSEKHNADRAVFLAHSKGETFLGVNEILFAEVQNKSCRIHTLKGSFQMQRQNLNETMTIIDDDFFIRCHRSFAINIKQLTGIEKIDRRIWKAVFKCSSETCLISKTYINHVTEKYKEFQVK